MRTVISDDDFAAMRLLLESVAGLVFDVSRRDSLAYSVNMRLDATGCPDVPAYLDLLHSSRGVRETQQLLDAVTIQETHFFRNPPQIQALRQHVLPELIRRAVVRDRPLTVWSAGCSTGEEPYTVAMLIREFLPMASTDQVRILATDVSANALAQAEAGTYGMRTVQMAEPTDVDRWFIARDGQFRVRDELRELVEFRRHNLASEPPPFEAGEVDLLLCRNVTIYFSRTTTKALMSRFFSVMDDGAYLFLGHAETLWQLSNAFTLVPLGDAFVYRKDPALDRRTVLPERRLLPDEPHLGAERRGDAAERRRAGKPPLGTRASSTRVTSARSTSPTRRRSDAAARPSGSPSGSPRGSGDAMTLDAAVTKDLLLPVPGGLPPAVAGGLTAARAALQEGRYGDAVALAGAAAASEPLLAASHLLAGQALMNLDRPADAMVALRKAIYLDPACAQGHLLLAGAQDRIGEYGAAARAYRAAASTFGAMPEKEVAAVFGGRDRAELVRLCEFLAAGAEARGTEGRG